MATMLLRQCYKSLLVPNINKTVFNRVCSRHSSFQYIQGQSPEHPIREYFYYMDHQGMLFLDDAFIKNFTSCFKDKQFLKFFFSRIKKNDTGRYYPDFPFLSLCGRERNYLRCDDVPIVFTQLLDSNSDAPLLSYGHCDRLLTVPFEPDMICMLPSTGRVYHTAKNKILGVGLVSDKLSIMWTEEKRFIFENGEGNPPTHFVWKQKKVKLTNHLLSLLKSLKRD